MKTYSADEVKAAANRAADDVQVALDMPDEGSRDVVNLVVNATVHYLDNPEASLVEAIEANYGADAGDVLEWCGSA